MHTCYHCGKTIKGIVKHTALPAIARGTNFNWTTYGRAYNSDFPRAYHPVCAVLAEKAAALDMIANDLSFTPGAHGTTEDVAMLCAAIVREPANPLSDVIRMITIPNTPKP